MTTIAFAWSGLPDYAARCIRAVIDRHPNDVVALGTRPEVPIEGMERSLGQPVHWIDGSAASLRWAELGLKRPRLFFQGGYAWPAFRALGKDCRDVGGKVVCLSDSVWRARWRQILIDPIRHRLLIRSQFDGLFVPGNGGLRHARIMGYNPRTTLPGMLGADPSVFNGGGPLHLRPKIILYVGRLVEGKNVVGLTQAFQQFAKDHPDWQLRICGSGPQRSVIPAHPQIQVEDFVQPLRLAELMRESRCLILPSLKEAWGLVVHEAALSGCALLLSTRVGATNDFARSDNAVLFAPGNTAAMEVALREIATWEEQRWKQAEQTSRKLASSFGPEAFANAVDQFMHLFKLTSSELQEASL